MNHFEQLHFYLIEGEILNSVNASRDSFKTVISNYDGLVNLIAEFYNRANIYTHSLRFNQIWHCKALLTEKLTSERYINMDLDDTIWSETSPYVSKINEIINCIESDVLDKNSGSLGKLCMNQLTTIVKQQLYSNVLPFKQGGCPYKWLLIEFDHANNNNKFQSKRTTRLRCPKPAQQFFETLEPQVASQDLSDSQRPVKIGVLDNRAVEDYGLMSFHIVSLYNDFVTKTILYLVNEHPFGQFNFDLVNLYNGKEELDWSERSDSRHSSLAPRPSSFKPSSLLPDRLTGWLARSSSFGQNSNDGSSDSYSGLAYLSLKSDDITSPSKSISDFSVQSPKSSYSPTFTYTYPICESPKSRCPSPTLNIPLLDRSSSPPSPPSPSSPPSPPSPTNDSSSCKITFLVDPFKLEKEDDKEDNKEDKEVKVVKFDEVDLEDVDLEDEDIEDIDLEDEDDDLQDADVKDIEEKVVEQEGANIDKDGTLEDERMTDDEKMINELLDNDDEDEDDDSLLDWSDSKVERLELSENINESPLPEGEGEEGYWYNPFNLLTSFVQKIGNLIY